MIDFRGNIFAFLILGGIFLYALRGLDKETVFSMDFFKETNAEYLSSFKDPVGLWALGVMFVLLGLVYLSSGEIDISLGTVAIILIGSYIGTLSKVAEKERAIRKKQQNAKNNQED